MTARQAALNVLSDVLSKGTYLNLALKDLGGFGASDQRFITALVTATLERLYTIDYVLSKFTDLKRTSGRVRNILRLGACQILYLNSVPDSAAVNESVTLAKRVAPSLRGYVNGVLRSVAREGPSVTLPDYDTDPLEFLSIAYSYPKWICAMFTEQFGSEEAMKLLSYTGTPGRTGMRRTVRAEGHTFPDSKPGIYLDDALYVQHASGLSSDPLLKEGRYTVQSESSMLCVRALGLAPDARVLDLCAAPGGKSAYAAQIAHAGRVTACDLHEHRTRLIEAAARRLKIGNLETVVWDATVLNPAWTDSFDAVLVDAPCSALGLMYRKPDIRYSRKQEDLTALHATQTAILECAQQYVKVGGTLVYSTCTIDRLENEEVVRQFLGSHPHFTSADLAAVLPGAFAERAARGQLQILPYRDDIDGFFISRMVRTADAPRNHHNVKNPFSGSA